jgi:hypothetical protein
MISLISETDILSCSTILTTYWDQPAPSFFNGSEDTPEYDRRKNVSLVIYAILKTVYPLVTSIGLRYRSSAHYPTLIVHRRALAGSGGCMRRGAGYADPIPIEGGPPGPRAPHARDLRVVAHSTCSFYEVVTIVLLLTRSTYLR